MSAGGDPTGPGIQGDPTLDRPDDDDPQGYSVRSEGFEAEGSDDDVVGDDEYQEDADDDVQGYYALRSEGFEASQGTEDDIEGHS